MLSTCTRRSQFRLRIASRLNRLIERKIQTDLDLQTAEFRAEELREKFEATATWLNPANPGSTANRCPEGRRAAAQCRWSRVRQDAEQSSDIAHWDDLIDQSPKAHDFVEPWNRPHMQEILKNWKR